MLSRVFVRRGNEKSGGGDVEVVFYFPFRIGGGRVGYADHFPGQVFAVEDEFYVVIVRVFGAFIEIVGVADDGDGGCAASAGDQIDRSVAEEAFVVMNVARVHDEADALALGRGGQVIGQGDFVGAGVVAGSFAGFDVGDGGMMQIEDHEADWLFEIDELLLDPLDLVAAES